MIRYADLFAGLGGFHLALTQTNIEFETVWTCEYDKSLIDLYQENFGVRPDKDVREVDINALPDFDFLTAGFPCQPFSVNNSTGKKGFDHDKGNLS